MNSKWYGKERYWPNLTPFSHLLGETDVNHEELQNKNQKLYDIRLLVKSSLS